MQQAIGLAILIAAFLAPYVAIVAGWQLLRSKPGRSILGHVCLALYSPVAVVYSVLPGLLLFMIVTGDSPSF